MPNTDKPMGFLPENDEAPKHPYDLSSTNTEILRGAPVTITSGYIVSCTAGFGAGGCCGIAAEYKAANSGGKIMVWDDPETRFIAQVDASGTSAQSWVGQLINMIDTHTSHNGVDSNLELDGSTIATTTTLDFLIVGLVDQMDLEAGTENAWGDHAKVIVKINGHELASRQFTS